MQATMFGLWFATVPLTFLKEQVMKTVYILRSISHPDQYYSGITGDMIERLNSHNAGQSPHTSKFKPWKLVVSIQLEDASKAQSFERYLKTGSGKAFSMRRFLAK